MPVWAQLWLPYNTSLPCDLRTNLKPWCSDGVRVLALPCLHCTTVDILPLSLFVPAVVLFTFWHLCRLSETAQCLLSAQSWWIPADGALLASLYTVNLVRGGVYRTNRVCLRQLFADLNLCFDRKPALALHLPENCMSLLEVLFSSI